jgi:hypothetical protein
VRAGVVAQHDERLAHVKAEALGQLALGLLDDDPAVQRRLQLLVERVAAAYAALVQQADGGHVGQRLTDPHILGVEAAGGLAEEVEGADDLVPQSHRERLHGGDPRQPRGYRELRPAFVGAEVGRCDRQAGPEAVQARALVAFQLEQLQQPRRLARGGDHAQLAARVRKQQADSRDVQQPGATVRQQVQEVNDVEVGDHRVRQLNERLGRQLPVHPVHPLSSRVYCPGTARGRGAGADGAQRCRRRHRSAAGRYRKHRLAAARTHRRC